MGDSSCPANDFKMKHAMNETQAHPQRREWRCFHRLVRWFRHAFGKHNLYCKCAGSWEIGSGKKVKGHHCTVTKWRTNERDHSSSSNAKSAGTDASEKTL